MDNNKFSSHGFFSESTKNQILIITYGLVLLLVVLNMNAVFSTIATILKLLTPFIIGFVMAYILNKPLKLIQNSLLKFMSKSKSEKVRKMQKPIAILLTYVLLIGLVAGFLGIVIPQMATSVTTLVSNISSYSSTVEEYVQKIADTFNLNGEIWEELGSMWTSLAKTLEKAITSILPSLVNFLTALATGVTKTFVGFIVSIYFLIGQDKLMLQIKRITYAFLNKKTADFCVKVVRLSHQVFGSFIIGQLTVAAILGALCFVAMTILRMPYAMLISVIVGVSNVIPYFGPFIGAVPGVFILFTQNPMQALFFIILVVVLQQIDNNFISPKIVGGNLGLSGVWVLFAITVGGGLFGIAGMIIGAPTFAVIYNLFGEAVEQKLKLKNIDKIQLEKIEK